MVVSIIRQAAVEGRLDAAVDFWLKEIGVDEVITRKFLTWDDNTAIPFGKSLIPISTATCRPSGRSPASGPSSA